jgi:multiple sugar transport system substrate-binding protein
VSAFRGLTWDHPRGWEALRAAARSREGVPAGAPFELSWDTHSLDGFESTPIEQTAAAYDLIVLDHPHLGAAIATESLIPLDEVFGQDELSRWGAACVGRTWTSYEYQGQVWALPLDAASQVSVARGALPRSRPDTWAEVEALAAEIPVALSLSGPHAALTFMSICVALGEEPASTADEFVSRGTGTAALELMTRLAARAPLGSELLDPIGLLETMATSNAIAYCPLVFGYVNYASATLPSPLAFGDSPRAAAGRPRGSTLGGTGLAITQNCSLTPALLDHLRWLMSETAQREFIPQHSGQPSARSGWDSESANAASGDFYRNTRATIEDAWVRPRYDGYIRFQSAASSLIRGAVIQSAGTKTAGIQFAGIEAVLTEINELYTKGIQP